MQTRTLAIELLDERTLLAGSVFDVNLDQQVTIGDVWAVYADLISNGERRLSPDVSQRVDIDGDGLATAEDLYWLKVRLEQGPELDEVFARWPPGDAKSPAGAPPLVVRVKADPGQPALFDDATTKQLADGSYVYALSAGTYRSNQWIPIDTSLSYALQGRFRAAGGQASVSLSLEASDAGLQLLSAAAPIGLAERQVGEGDSSWQYPVSGVMRGEASSSGTQPSGQPFPAGTAYVRFVVSVAAVDETTLVELDELNFLEVVDVTTWGASGTTPAGDGVTNDAEALQSCIDQLPSGSTLYFPEDRTFRVDGQLFLGNHVSLLGQDNTSSGLALNKTLLTEEDPRFGFWINFGIERRFGDLLDLELRDALALSRGTDYSGRITNLRFTLGEEAVTTRALLFHSAKNFVVENNVFDGMLAPLGKSISWASQQVVGASIGAEGYVSSNAYKESGVYRDNVFDLNQLAYGGEQVGIGPLASDMTVEGNLMRGSGDDCVGAHLVTGFRIVDNTCYSVDGRIFVGSSDDGLIEGNRVEHTVDALGQWGIGGSLIEVSTEGVFNPTSPTNIAVLRNHLYAGAEEPISFGIRTRGGDELAIVDNVIESFGGSIDAVASTPSNAVLRDVFYGIRVEHFQNDDVTYAPGKIDVVGNRVISYGPAQAEIGRTGLAPGQLTVDRNYAERFALSGSGVVLGPDNVLVNIGDQPFDDRLPGGGRFDFGTSVSPVGTDFAQVNSEDAYSVYVGFGWLSGTIREGDRAKGSDADRDYNYTRSGEFVVDVPNGEYEIEVALGDAGRYAHDRMGIEVEGELLGEVSTTAGEVTRRTYRTEVRDGQLTLGLRDLGGRDANVVMESLIVRFVNEDVAPMLALSASPDSFSETAGSAASQLTVTRTGDLGAAITVDLSHDGGSLITMPASIDFAPGQSVAQVWLQANDNGEHTGQRDVTISASAVGYTTETIVIAVTDDEVPPYNETFDFGTGASPVASGATEVTLDSLYSPARGFGWTAGAISAADRRSGSDLERDFHFTQDGTFAVDLPNGRYRITVTLGDLGRYAHDEVGLYLQGAQRDTISTQAREIVAVTHEVDVENGQLTLRIRDLGGRDRNGVLNAVHIELAGPQAPMLSVQLAPGAITEASGVATATVERTGSFDEPLLVSLSSSDPTEVIVPDAVMIPAGSSMATFDVTALDDAEVDGVQVVTITATAAGFVDGTALVDVFDDDAPPFEASFDFGTSNSPLATGYTRVSESSAYSPAVGHGWIGAAAASRSRTFADALEQDFVFGPQLTFVVDVPAGVYRVDVLMGDRGSYAHDEMGIYLEGQQQASVTTAGGEMQTLSFVVEVDDGQLTIDWLDLGGRDRNVTVAGLRVSL